MAAVDETAPLLPTIALVKALVVDASTSIDGNIPPADRFGGGEVVLISSIFALITIITSILNLHFKNPRLYLLHLAQLLPQSLYLGIPTALIFFVASPAIVKPGRVAFSWCLVLFCYLFKPSWALAFLVLVGSGLAARQGRYRKTDKVTAPLKF